MYILDVWNKLKFKSSVISLYTWQVEYHCMLLILLILNSLIQPVVTDCRPTCQYCIACRPRPTSLQYFPLFKSTIRFKHSISVRVVLQSVIVVPASPELGLSALFCPPGLLIISSSSLTWVIQVSGGAAFDKGGPACACLSCVLSLVTRAVGYSDTPAYCGAADSELVSWRGIEGIVSVSIQVGPLTCQTHGGLSESLKGKTNAAASLCDCFLQMVPGVPTTAYLGLWQ